MSKHPPILTPSGDSFHNSSSIQTRNLQEAFLSVRPAKSAPGRRLQVEPVARWARRPSRPPTAAGVVLVLLLAVAATVQGRGAEHAEKEALASHRRMLQALKELRERTPTHHPVLGEVRARHLRAELEAVEAGRKKAGFFPQVTRWRLHFDLGREELQLGNEQRSLEHSYTAFKLLPEVQNLLRADLPIRLRFQLGVSHLRVGETQNCCLRSNPESCILPIREGGIHTEPEGSRQAIRYFTQVLKESSSDSMAYLESRWLLNIAHMTLGSYPEGVPRDYLIPPKVFQSDDSFPRFHNIAADLGLDTFNLAGGACADDFNNDGYLDLVVSTWDPAEQMRFFVNNGDGTFSDVARQAGVTNDRWTKAVIWGDYDEDGYSDLYVSNFWELNRLYRNNRDGTFTDVADKLGVTHPMASFPSWFWDFDNDGVLDLYVTAFTAIVADLAAASLDLPFETELPRLYRGDGQGGFEEISQQQDLDRPAAPMGSNFGDLDNDGFLDFYLGTGTPDYHDLMPNLMYHNQRGKRFADVSIAGGFAHLQKGHGIIFADFDHDGDQDIFEQMGGAYAGDKYGDALYENPGFGHHWITIQLVGVRSNRSAIGARIRLDVEEQGKPRAIFKTVNSGGTFGANPLRQTIGLGRASKIKRLEIFWPTTGETQVFGDVPADRFIRIVESESRYRRLSLPKFVLGGGGKGKKEALLPRGQGAK